jgi:hypothetical protein
MAVRTKTEMSLEDFGKALLDTRDLDSVYVVLWRAYRGLDMTWPTLRKWLLAYWCFLPCRGSLLDSRRTGTCVERWLLG